NTTTSRCQVGTPPCAAPDACTTVTCDPTTGACGAPTPVNCDDGNPCTTDSCDPTTGCAHAANTATCTIADFCAQNPAAGCSNGTDLCVQNPLCSNGSCTATPTPLAAGCNDGNICNGIEACNPANGQCETVTPDPCNDNNPCTTDSCANNLCSNTPLP